jgi:hypothetical protein
MSLPIMSFKNNKATITIAVAALATLFFCSVSLGDLVSAYGSIRGGGGFAGGGSGGFSGGGVGRSSEHVGSPGGGATYLLLILVVLLQVATGDYLAQVVFKEAAITPMLLVIPTVLFQVAEPEIIPVLVLWVPMVHTVLVLPAHVNQIT